MFRFGRSLIAGFALAGLVGCGSVAPTQKPGPAREIEFMRGCWVMKDQTNGHVVSFLRLLPPSTDANVYEGTVQLVNRDPPVAATHFSFVRDGSSVMRTSAKPDQFFSGRYEAVGDLPADSEIHKVRGYIRKPIGVVTVEGAQYPTLPETLSINVRNEKDELAWEFVGERDGCD